MNIEIPWNIGDKGFALYENTVSTNEVCDSCKHSHRKNERISEVRECIIDGMDIGVYGNRPMNIYYRVAFNEGQYGTTVNNVWKTKEEAEANRD